jgi:hypothetical protein
MRNASALAAVLALAACEPLMLPNEGEAITGRWAHPSVLNVSGGDDVVEATHGAAATWMATGLVPPIRVVKDPTADFSGRAPLGNHKSTVSFRENLGVLAGTFVFADDARLFYEEAHILLSTSGCFNDGTPPPGGASRGCYDLQSVLTHEMGHALGITFHVEDCETSATMDPGIYPFSREQRTLSDCDVDALADIYDLPAGG